MNSDINYLDFGCVFKHEDDEYQDGKTPIRLIIEELPDGRFRTLRYVKKKLYDSGYFGSVEKTVENITILASGVDPMQPLIDAVCRHRGINPASLGKL